MTDLARRARRALEAGRQLGRQAGREAAERRPFTITKFERTAEGYFHARVTPANGKPVYVHRKFGSWMAPGTQNAHAVLREVLPEVAAELQVKARAAEKAERTPVTPISDTLDKSDSECGTMPQSAPEQETNDGQDSAHA